MPDDQQQPDAPRRTLAVGIGAILLVALIIGALVMSQQSADTTTADSAVNTEEAREVLGPNWTTDVSQTTIDLDDIRGGGPPKDGIPSIDDPSFIPVDEVDFLSDREPVVSFEGRAYPIQILTWHEIVNDDVDGTPVAVTYCPLCNTAIIFDRRVGGDTLEFGVSGFLRENNLLMYDRQTETLWQQFDGEAVVGTYAGERLDILPARIISWEDFTDNHPDGQVLSRDTGYDRRYGSNPYEGYDAVGTGPLFATEASSNDPISMMSPVRESSKVCSGSETGSTFDTPSPWSPSASALWTSHVMRC